MSPIQCSVLIVKGQLLNQSSFFQSPVLYFTITPNESNLINKLQPVKPFAFVGRVRCLVDKTLEI